MELSPDEVEAIIDLKLAEERGRRLARRAMQRAINDLIEKEGGEDDYELFLGFVEGGIQYLSKIHDEVEDFGQSFYRELPED